MSHVLFTFVKRVESPKTWGRGWGRAKMRLMRVED
jgi:hypothetical protein